MRQSPAQNSEAERCRAGLIGIRPAEMAWRKSGLHHLSLPLKLLLCLLLAPPPLALAENRQITQSTSDHLEDAQPEDTLTSQGFESPPTDTSTDETSPPAEAPEDLCDWYLEGKELQEQTRDVVYGISCHSFRWFDHLFGDEIDYPEQQVNGLWLLGFEYSEYDGFDFRGRFRVRAPLPNLDNRWDVIVGRENEGEFVSDTAPAAQTLFNPGLSRDEDNEWLLGLGQRRQNRRRGFDYSVGLRIGTPGNLYGKVQYYYNKQFTQKTDLQFRQTFFWRTDEGLGTTSRANLIHNANVKNVFRWEGVATVSEDTEGMKWYAGQTWYHQLRGKNAVSLLAFIRGETDEEVPLRDYGLSLIWRQPFTRDWMFLSMGPSITWPRTFLTEERELSLGFGMWIEMEFGDYRY
jgi:hypothetical protein